MAKLRSTPFPSPVYGYTGIGGNSRIVLVFGPPKEWVDFLPMGVKKLTPMDFLVL